MAPRITKRKLRKPRLRRQKTYEASPVARTEGLGQVSQEARNPDELPSREALVAHLETQRAELLHAMSCLDVARRTIEQHLANPPFGSQLVVSPKDHEFYRGRVLETLNDAGEALRTAYPMLERIAQALAVEEILREHTPPVEATASESPSGASISK